MADDPTVPQTVAPAEDASNQAPVTSNDAVLAMLANMNDALQALNARVNAIPNAPATAAAASLSSPVEARNVEPPEEAHPDHLNGVYHVLHELINRAGLDENRSIALHNAIPNVNPPEEAQAA